MIKDIISDNLWNAINDNVPIRNISLEKGKITFDLTRSYFIGKNANYSVTLERLNDFDNEHLFCTIIFEGIVIKEKLHRMFFMRRLNKNTSFNNMSIYLTGILSFEAEKTKRGLQ